MNLLLAAVGLLFVGLKLTGHIGWSWWLVLLPLYAPLVVTLVVAGCLFAIAGITWLSMTRAQRNLYRAKVALREYADLLARRDDK